MVHNNLQSINMIGKFFVNTINKQPLIIGNIRSNLQSGSFDNCNGISVIDFDIKNNVNGLQNFFNKGFTVNNTSCVLTPFHLYFRTNQLKLFNIKSSVREGC